MRKVKDGGRVFEKSGMTTGIARHHRRSLRLQGYDYSRSGDCRGNRLVAPTGPCPQSLGSLMAVGKSAVTKRINQTRQTPGAKLWQRNHYEHIIRNNDDLSCVQRYIIDNPEKWESDRKNPEVVQTTATTKKKFEEVGV